MRHDADLLKDLPEGSSARETMLDHLAWQSQELRTREASGAKRDWSSVGLGLFLSLGFGYLTVWLIQHGGWWLVGTPITATLALAGLVGVSEGIALKVRPTKEEKEAEKQRQRDDKAMKKAEKAAQKAQR